MVADDHRFLIGCKTARTAPGSSGSLKVPGPINPISPNPLFRLAWIRNQLCSTSWNLEPCHPRGLHRSFVVGKQMSFRTKITVTNDYCCLFCTTWVMFITAGQFRECWGRNDDALMRCVKVCVSFS